MATQLQVVYAWRDGRELKSSYCERANNYYMRTDGYDLFSYGMRIGRTLEYGTKQVLLVQGAQKYTVSTAKHVSLARRVTQCVIAPKNYRFQGDSTSEWILLSNKTWKTKKGVLAAIAKLPKDRKYTYGQEHTGYSQYFTIYFLQTTDSTGKVITNG